MDASDRSSIVLDSPGGRTAGAVPRALPPSISSAREAFARRVVIACHSPEEWRADPRALWNLVVSNFGQRHEHRKILRVQSFIKGFSPINGESLHAYLTRFETEIAAIELESPNLLGSELAMPLYLQTSLQHIPQCQVVFAKMLGKDKRPYSKYRRYLLNAYEEPNIGHWKMKAMPGRSSDNSDVAQGAAPSTIAGAQARSKPPAAAASAAAAEGKKAGSNATSGRWPKCWNCGQVGHRFYECSQPPTAETLARKNTCPNCKGSHAISACPDPVVRCTTCRRYGHQEGQCPPRKKSVSFKPKGGSAVGSICVTETNPPAALPVTVANLALSQGSAEQGAHASAAPAGVPAAADDSHWDGIEQDPLLFHSVSSFCVAALSEASLSDELECVARVPSTDGRGNTRKPVPAGRQGKIILDSGANLAITNRREVFTRGLRTDLNISVEFVNGDKAAYTEGGPAFGLPLVVYDPLATGTFLSQCQLRRVYRLEALDNGAMFCFYDWNSGTKLLEFAEQADGLLHLAVDFTARYGVEQPYVVAGVRAAGRVDFPHLSALLLSLHREFGHVGVQQLRSLAQATTGRLIDPDIFRAKMAPCTSCLMAKMHRQPFPRAPQLHARR